MQQTPQSSATQNPRTLQQTLTSVQRYPETARVLGMGPKIYTAQGLPVLGADGAIPAGLVADYGTKICPADGFASVFPEHKYLIVETLRLAGFRCGMTGMYIYMCTYVCVCVCACARVAHCCCTTLQHTLQIQYLFCRAQLTRNICIYKKYLYIYYIYIGDGVNDAPALKRADVGIAVQGATDAARAAADLVLTGEGLGTIIDGIEISREIFARLKNFISYRIAATLQLLTFFFIAVFAFPPLKYYEANGFEMSVGNYSGEIINVPRMSPYCLTGYDSNIDMNPYLDIDFNNPKSVVGVNGTGCDIVLPICEMKNGEEVCGSWPAFFQLPVLMLMLITLLNDGALISVGYDKVTPSPIPEQWNLARLFIVATVMGGVAMGSSLLLLGAALDSNNPSGIFAGMNLPPMEYGKIVCMVYLKVRGLSLVSLSLSHNAYAMLDTRTHYTTKTQHYLGLDSFSNLPHSYV